MSLYTRSYDILAPVGSHAPDTDSSRESTSAETLWGAGADRAAGRWKSPIRCRIEHGTSPTQCGSAQEETSTCPGGHRSPPTMESHLLWELDAGTAHGSAFAPKSDSCRVWTGPRARRVREDPSKRRWKRSIDKPSGSSTKVGHFFFQKCKV